MNNWNYPVKIVEENGDFVVTFRDFPEATTSGDNYKEALELAKDALEVCVAGRIEDELELPFASKMIADEVLVNLPILLAAKASVYKLWQQSGISKSELAKRLGKTENEARRILAPRHGTKITLLDDAARALGSHLTISIS
jgi:antitoxin HicB